MRGIDWLILIDVMYYCSILALNQSAKLPLLCNRFIDTLLM